MEERQELLEHWKWIVRAVFQAEYNALMKRREQLSNFIYVSDFTIFTNNGILLDAAVELAKKSINKIDLEIGKL